MSLSPKRFGRRPLGDIHNTIQSPTSKCEFGDLHTNSKGSGFGIFTDSFISPKKRRLVSSVQRNEFIGGESTTSGSSKNSREDELTKIINAEIHLEISSPQHHTEYTLRALSADGSHSLKSNSKKRKDHRAKNTSSPDVVLYNLNDTNVVHEVKFLRRLTVQSANDNDLESGNAETVKSPGTGANTRPPEEGNLNFLSQAICKSELKSAARNITLLDRCDDNIFDGCSSKISLRGDFSFYSVDDEVYFHEPSTDDISLKSGRMDNTSIINSCCNDSLPPTVKQQGGIDARMEEQRSVLGIAFKPRQTDIVDTETNIDLEVCLAAAVNGPADAAVLCEMLKSIPSQMACGNVEAVTALTDVSYASILQDIERMKLQGAAPKMTTFRIQPVPLPSLRNLEQVDERGLIDGMRSPLVHNGHGQARTIHHRPVDGAAEVVDESQQGLSEAEAASVPIIGPGSESVQAAPSQSLPSASPSETPEDVNDEDREFSLFHLAVVAARESSLAVLFKGSRGRAGQGLTPVQQHGVAFYKSEVRFMSSSAVIRRGELLAPLGSHRLDTTVLSTPKKDRIEECSLQNAASPYLSNVQLTSIQKNGRLPQPQYLSARVPLSDLEAYQDKLHIWRGKYRKVGPAVVSRIPVDITETVTASRIVKSLVRECSECVLSDVIEEAELGLGQVQVHGGKEKTVGVPIDSVLSDLTPHHDSVLCV